MKLALLFCLPALLLSLAALSPLCAAEKDESPAPDAALQNPSAPLETPVKSKEPTPESFAKGQAAIRAAAARATFQWFALTEADAVAKAKEQGLLLRVVERDGRGLPTTRDFRKGRLNISLMHGLVMRQTSEGSADGEGCRNAALLPYLGLTEKQASALAKKNAVQCRTTVRDGQGLPATADMVLDRVNFVTRAGIVVGVGNG